MKKLLYISFICLTMGLLASCEKDFIEDVECKPTGNGIGGWNGGDSTDVETPKDTAPPSFHIELTEWGDTIYHDIIL